MAGGFRDLLTWLGWRSAEPGNLNQLQRITGGEPVVTLMIGSHSLDAFVWGYRYEEKAEDSGSLTIWLLNKGDEFDDLSTDYPDLKRGAAIDLRRGLPVAGVDTTEKLPRTWIEGLRYVYIEGTPLLELHCIDWRERLSKFRYSAEETWSAADVATIAGDILGEVGLTLAAGTFGFIMSYTASPRRAADQVLLDVMRRVEEYLYSGVDGEILHKELAPTEVPSYQYGWSVETACHPCLPGSEIAETSARYNHVVVNGDLSYTGSSTDATEIALVGTRLRTITDKSLTSDAQCAERAQAELRFWLAQTLTGKIVARPHFTLRMYDVLEVLAPPWGGPAVTGRVRRIVEEYGRGRSLWHQIIEIGGLAGQEIGAADLSDGAVDSSKMIEGAVTVDELAANAVTAGKIKAGEIDTQHLAADAVEADKIAAGAIDTEHLAAGAVEADKINVSSLSAISADMGTLTAGVIKMGTGTKDADLSGFQIDASELVGQNSGVDQVVLSSSDGKITAGAGAVVLSADGIHCTAGTSDVNKHKIRHGLKTIFAMYGERDAGVGSTNTLEGVGIGADDPEGLVEVIAITHDGAVHSGVASVSITLKTEDGDIEVDGALRMVMGTCFVEMTEQADPAAPGANRGRLYVRDNGAGKSQLCVRFNTGAVQVVATEP